ncbi:hypothetical protein HDU81_004372 [Chytriomyces hyalinus]|nr:hypothetical protein HDU81_004372 [Chytriomyces hyalinus]
MIQSPKAEVEEKLNAKLSAVRSELKAEIMAALKAEISLRSEDELDPETHSLTRARWKAVLKKYHPNAYILQFLDEAVSNRPVLKILRIFIDEFIKTRGIITDHRFREIPEDHYMDFIAHLEAKSFDVPPVAEGFSINMGAIKPARGHGESGRSGGGSGGSVGRKRGHVNHDADVDYTPSMRRLDDMVIAEADVVGFEKEAEGQVYDGDRSSGGVGNDRS